MREGWKIHRWEQSNGVGAHAVGGDYQGVPAMVILKARVNCTAIGINTVCVNVTLVLCIQSVPTSPPSSDVMHRKCFEAGFKLLRSAWFQLMYKVFNSQYSRENYKSIKYFFLNKKILF